MSTVTENNVNSVAFSPDDSLLASAGTATDSTTMVPQGWVGIWDVLSGNLLRTLKTSSNEFVNSVAFSPNGAMVAAGGAANTGGVLDIWNPINGVLVRSLTSQNGSGVSTVAFSPDSTMIADGGNTQNSGIVEIRSIATGDGIARFASAANRNLNSICFSGDGKVLVVGGTGETPQGYEFGVVELWSIPAGKLITTLFTNEWYVNSIEFSPDGQYIAVGGMKFRSSTNSVFGAVELWSVPLLSLLKTLPLPEQSSPVHSIAFTPDSATLFVGTDLGLFSFNASANSLLNYYNIDGVESVGISPNNLLIGLATTTNKIAIVKNPTGAMIPIASLAMNPSSVVGGNSSSGTITLSQPAPTGGVSITLTSNSSQCKVPAFVQIPAGATVGTFTATTTGVSTQENIVVTASNVISTQTSQLTIYPAGLASIQVSSSVIGGDQASGTLTLSGPAGSGGAIVALTSSRGEVTVPSTVTIAEGQTTANFTISSLGVDSTVHVSILGSISGQERSANIDVNPAVLLKLTLSPTTVSGGTPSNGTVAFDGTAGPSGIVILLTCNNPTASVLKSITVSPGRSNATFMVNTQPVTVQTVTQVTASVNSKAQVAALTITPLSLISVSIAPTSIVGGNTATGTVTLSGNAGTNGIVVNLSSTSTSVTIPSTVTVASGQSIAAFPIKASALTAQKTVTITAKVASTIKSATLTITLPTLVSIAVAPTTIVGGASSTGTVTLSDPAIPGGMVVKLTSNNASAIVPTSVIIPAGKVSATFPISTKSVSSQKVASLVASMNSVSSTAILTITAPSLSSLTLKPTSVKGGTPSVGTVTLTSAAPVGGLVISLSSSQSFATVPTTVTVAAGKTTATFTVKTVHVSATKSVTISGFSGSSSASAVLTIQ